MSGKKNLEALAAGRELEGAAALVRVDFNVPLDKVRIDRWGPEDGSRKPSPKAALGACACAN